MVGEFQRPVTKSSQLNGIKGGKKGEKKKYLWC